MTARAIPKQVAAVSYSAIAVAAAVIAAGVVAVRDAVLAAGWIVGTPWIPAGIEAIDGLTPSGWSNIAGAGAVLLGVVLLTTAVKRRRPRGVPVVAGSSVYIEPTDIARLASATAEQIPGVIAARTAVSPRTVTIRCRVTGPVDHRLIQDDVSGALAALASPPRIRVQTRTEDRA